MSQIISDPTHILPNSSSSIDLIFTNQPNSETETGVCPSLRTKCHHQTIFTKLILKVEYSPLYERLIWDYKNPDRQWFNNAIKKNTKYGKRAVASICNSLIETIRASKENLYCQLSTKLANPSSLLVNTQNLRQ